MKKVIFIIVLIVFVIEACSVQQKEKDDSCSATLFIVHDNYPRGYKTTIGDMSYTRDILLAFYIKNATGRTLLLPINDKYSKDTCFFLRISQKQIFVDLPCSLYRGFSQEIPPGDSLAIAVHLHSDELNKLDVNLDNESFENVMIHLGFDLYTRNEELTRIVTNENFDKKSIVKYKYGRLFVEYCKNGNKKEIEEYEDSCDSIIVDSIKRHRD